MSEYFLIEHFIGGTRKEIDQGQFETLVICNKVIKIIWDCEDNFALLGNSFVEFEEHLLKTGVRFNYGQEVRQNSDHFFDIARQEINLKLVTFLTAARVYEDQLYSQTSQLSKLTGKAVDVREIFRSAFDKRLEYRVMTALRNHALHQGLPLGTISLGTANFSDPDEDIEEPPSRCRLTVDPMIDAKELIASKKLRKKTRSEVEKLGCRFLDLKFLVRSFVSELYNCHEAVRAVLEPTQEEALQGLQTAHEELAQVKGGEVEPKHVSVVASSDGVKEQEDYIDFSQKGRLVEIQNHWTGLKSADRAYISSEVSIRADTYPSHHPEIWIPK